MWFETLKPVLIDECKFTQSDVDPCYFYKEYPDGSRFDLGLYVDDKLAVDDAGALADADWKIINKHFKFTIQEDPKHFLNMNVNVESETRVKLSMEAYVLRMADANVPDWRIVGTSLNRQAPLHCRRIMISLISGLHQSRRRVSSHTGRRSGH